MNVDISEKYERGYLGNIRDRELGFQI